MVTTHEPAHFDRTTGERVIETWHSCPRYFGNSLLRVLTLGFFGVGWGHDSHDANSVSSRQWA